MKVWELEEGKEYVATDKNFGERHYKIEDGEFIYFDEEEGWILSLRNFKQLNDLNFTEYTPPTDWSKVEVDTKVLVSDSGEKWVKRYFARYDVNSKKLYVWDDGTTSWSANGRMLPWTYAKLYTEE